MAAPGPRHAGAIAGGDRPRMSGEMGSQGAHLVFGGGAREFVSRVKVWDSSGFRTSKARQAP